VIWGIASVLPIVGPISAERAGFVLHEILNFSLSVWGIISSRLFVAHAFDPQRAGAGNRAKKEC